MGHAYEMAKASNVTIEIESKKVPIIEEAIELGEMGLVPGGAYSNKGFIEDKITWLKDIPEIYKDLLFDPQTLSLIHIYHCNKVKVVPTGACD